jgi:hypothetical protein
LRERPMFDATREGNAEVASCEAGETLALAFCPSDGSPRVPKVQMAHHWSLFAMMNVSSSDLNNVQQAGDYSFRDGTITVTFAEVAIWKNNPNAQFRLMRKHPIRGVPRYVLREAGRRGVSLGHFFAHLSKQQRRHMVFNKRSSNGRPRRHAQAQPAIRRPSVVRRNRKIPLRRRKRS